MKKRINLLFLSVFALALLLLVSCGAIEPAHNHVYSSSWSSDDESHWRESTCEHELIVNLEGHTMDEGSVTTPPTVEAEGVFTYACTVCKRALKTEPIAKLTPPVDESLTHKHTFSDTYVYNDYYHWQTASCEHTEVTSAKTAHAYLDNICIYCHYIRPSEGLDMALLPDGTYAVMGPGVCDDTTIYIPAVHNGKKVSSIADGAFRNYEIMSALILPTSVVSIGSYAFAGCKNISYVDIQTGSSLKSIGNGAFQNCAKLSSISIPATVSSLGESMFYYCRSLPAIVVGEGCEKYKTVDGVLYTKDGLTLMEYAPGKTDAQYTIPKEVTTLGPTAFAASDYLEKIIFEDGSLITSIPYQAFYYIRHLKEIDIPDAVTYIGEMAFDHCMELREFVIPEGIRTVTKGMLAFCTSLTEIVIPEGVTRIERDAFSNCTSLVSINIPAGVTTIGNEAFAGCLALPEIFIPAKASSLGSNLFNGCTSLASVTVEEGNKRYSSIDGNLYNKAQTTLVYYAEGKTDTDFTLPTTVTKIEYNAFYCAQNLKNVSLPEGLVTIGDTAFFKCARLETINLPSTLTSIGVSCFQDCPKLKSITIPEGITHIPEKAFNNCDSLTEIYLHSGIVKIDVSAFAYCAKLTSVVFADTEGWWITLEPSATSGQAISSIELADPATATALITESSKYQAYYWRKGTFGE